MKSATSTLQEQLACQPGIFMTDPKEPNFFSDDEQFDKGMDWYSNLFSHAGEGDLLGEASTHYTKLETYPETVQRIKAHAPRARFVYVMRHPLDRLVSHYQHEWSNGVCQSGINEAVRSMSELVGYGKYAEQLQSYIDVFGKPAILPVFFDRLIESPQVELERICRFIGYSRKPIWRYDLRSKNVSKERIRRFPLYDLLIDSRVASFLRRKLVPRSIRNKVKSFFTMSDKPRLDQNLLNELTKVFDADLKILGDHLGVDLNCENFKAVTAARSLDWVEE